MAQKKLGEGEIGESREEEKEMLGVGTIVCGNNFMEYLK